MVNLYSYLIFRNKIMSTADPNGSLWLTEATDMDTNGCDMPNGSNFAQFLGNTEFCGVAWRQNEELGIL